MTVHGRTGVNEACCFAAMDRIYVAKPRVSCEARELVSYQALRSRDRSRQPAARVRSSRASAAWSD
jgi:hypothetical protein